VGLGLRLLPVCYRAAAEDTPESTSEPTRESFPEDTLSSALGALRVTQATTSSPKKRESTGSVSRHTRFEPESESDDDDDSDERAAVRCTEEQAATEELRKELAPVQPTDTLDWVLERKGRRMVLSGAVASRLYPHQRQGVPRYPHMCLPHAYSHAYLAALHCGV
jgi:hypothetical protein